MHIMSTRTKLLSVVITVVFASALASQSMSSDNRFEDKEKFPVELILLGVIGSMISS